MANSLITPSTIAKEALMHLKNNMVMGSRVHREYKKEFVKVGASTSIRKPVKFVASDGATRVNQNVSEDSVAFVINKHKHVSWNFSVVDLTLSIAEYSKRYIQPAAIALANIVDEDLCKLYQDVPMAVGTAGNTPTSYKNFAQSAAEMNKFSVPKDQRSLVLDSDADLEASVFMSNLNAPQLVESAVRSMRSGIIGKQEQFMDQNVQTHTAGTNFGDTAYQVDGASQEGSTLTVDTGNGTFVKGDIITIANVLSVNPISRVAHSTAQKFVVTANMASGGTSLSIYPAIVTSGAHQNVDAGPTNNASITIVDTHQANLAFQRNAFGLVMIPIELPDGAAFKARETHENVSIAVVKAFDIENYVDIIRLDILYGVKTIYPELACRSMG